MAWKLWNSEERTHPRLEQPLIEYRNSFHNNTLPIALTIPPVFLQDYFQNETAKEKAGMQKKINNK